MVAVFIILFMIIMVAYAAYNIWKAPPGPQTLTEKEKHILKTANISASSRLSKSDPNYEAYFTKYRDDYLRKYGYEITESGIFQKIKPMRARLPLKYRYKYLLKRGLVISGISLYLGSIISFLWFYGVSYGWIVFACFMAMLMLSAIICNNNDSSTPLSDFIDDAVLYTMLAVAAIAFLSVLAFIWYYFCFGFLVFEAAESFTDILIYLFISLIGLGFFVGLIAIFFGWNPK